MNRPEEVAQLSLGDSESSHNDSWATLTGQAKPIAKDCDGRTLLGKRHNFEQNNRKNESSLTKTRTRTVTSTSTSTQNHSTLMHRHSNNNNNNNINTTGTTYINNKNTSPVTINISDIPSKSNGIRPSPSYSMPINSPSQRPLSFPPPGLDDEERMKLMSDIMQAKEELLRFRNEMDGLAQQINGMELDLKDSKDRVLEIEDDLTSTQEVNVDLQVLLENAVKTQKESDGKTTHMIRNMHSNLANIVYENSQLQERLASLALHQEKYHGNVMDVGERMREYAHMLEQAQGTIQFLQAPPRYLSSSSRPLVKTKEDILNALSIRDGLSSRRASDVSSMYLTEDEEVLGIASRKQSETTTFITTPSVSPDSAVASISSVTTSSSRPGSISPDIAELYRHRIIRKRPSLPSGGMSPLFSSVAAPITKTATHVNRTSIKEKNKKHTPSSPVPVPVPVSTTPTATGGIAIALDDNSNSISGGIASSSPQQGLRLLLRNQGGHGLGLSSIPK